MDCSAGTVNDMHKRQKDRQQRNLESAALSLREERSSSRLVLRHLVVLMHLAVLAVCANFLRARHHRKQLPPLPCMDVCVKRFAPALIWKSVN
eukprot:3428185-Rhodomonas_salina.2